jgi:transcriptional regulator with XRE-family HTH domain
MKRPRDRYNCDEELGKRLRECRVRAGLTQQKLATAMGRQGKGGHHVAGRLERGEVPSPGVGLLADYLRACRASFADIQDVLDRYTAKQTVIEVETQKALAKVREFLPAKVDRAVERFDRGIVRRAEAKHEPLPAHEERVKRSRSFALSQIWAWRVRRRVVDIIDIQHLYPGPDGERYMQSYAVRVWSALNRSRGKRAGRRQALLERATALRPGEEIVKSEYLQAVRDGLVGYFQQAEMAGQLDTEPKPEPGETEPRRGFRPKPDTRQEREAWDKARAALVEQLWQEISQRPELAGVEPRILSLYLSVVRQICTFVDQAAPESDHCRKQVEDLVTNEHFASRGRDPAVVRKLAQIVIPRWEDLRTTLGLHPLARVRPPR